jgi:uncharacterized protein YbjQ (UPF0145 family)
MADDIFELPKHALERLQGMVSNADQKGLFTSDLSVNEFLCIKEAGFEPLGLVMGSSVYHIGFQMPKWGKNAEMETLTQAMYHARELAISRMEEEADALHADGVVGVRLEVNRAAWGENNAEFIAIGTAVRAVNRNQDYLTNKRKPFTSDLSGQDFWTLLQSGYRPLSLVMGTCVYHIARQGITKALSRVGRNVELTNYTQALYDARELAMERMQKEAQAEDADGIVGVQVKEGSYGWDPQVIEYYSVGTAVTKIESTAETHEIKKPELVLTLND